MFISGNKQQSNMYNWDKSLFYCFSLGHSDFLPSVSFYFITKCSSFDTCFSGGLQYILLFDELDTRSLYKIKCLLSNTNIIETCTQEENGIDSPLNFLYS